MVRDQYLQRDTSSIVWGAAPSQGEEGTDTIRILLLFRCPECGHDQSVCSVVLRVHLNVRIREFYINHDGIDGIESDSFYCDW